MSIEALVAGETVMDLRLRAHPAAIGVYWKLCGAANRHGWTRYAVETLAGSMPLSSFKRHMATLVQAGILVEVTLESAPGEAREAYGHSPICRRVPTTSMDDPGRTILGLEPNRLQSKMNKGGANLTRGVVRPPDHSEEKQPARPPDSSVVRPPDRRDDSGLVRPPGDEVVRPPGDEVVRPPDYDPVSSPLSDPLEDPPIPPSASGRLRGPDVGASDPALPEGPPPTAQVSGVAAAVSVRLLADVVADLEALGRPPGPQWRRAVEKRLPEFIAGTAVRQQMRSQGLNTKPTITAEEVGQVLRDAWGDIRLSSFHFTKGKDFRWLLTRPKLTVEHAVAERDRQDRESWAPNANARRLADWWVAAKADQGFDEDMTIDEGEANIAAMLSKGTPDQQAKAPDWIREQLERVVADPRQALGPLTRSYTSLQSAAAKAAPAAPRTTRDVLNAELDAARARSRQRNGEDE